MSTLKYIYTFLFFLASGTLYAQPWLNLLPKDKSDKNPSFYEVQKAFNQYWQGKNVKDKSVTKSKGYKPFKRYENWMIPRVYPNGYIKNDAIWVEYQKEIQKKALKGAPISNWTALGPGKVPLDLDGKPSGIGRINCVAFDPNDANVMYTGSPSGGFWKTINGGNSWATTTDQLASIGVSDIAINPQNPDIIYIATGDGDASDTYSIGVLKSLDAGTTWNTTGLSFSTGTNRTIRKILINPSKPDNLIVATNLGISKSTDAGVNWIQVQSGNFKDIEFKSDNPDIVFAARYGSNNSRFYKSIDGGNTFSEINTGVNLLETYRLELAVGGTSASNVIYALYSNNDDDGFHSLWKSINEGQTWTKVYDKSISNLLGWNYNGADAGGQGWYDLSLIVSPLNSDEIYVGGVNIWKSINSGANWNLVGHWNGSFAPYVHADHHYLVYSPAGVLYNGNDGGLYKTSNSGIDWTDISNGLKILQIDRIGASQTNANIVIAGNQDNGTMKYDGSSGEWKQILAGDGCECIVDFTNDKTIYVSYIKGDINRSDDGGYSFTSIKPTGSGEGLWHTPYIINPLDNKTLYAGFDDIWKTNDKGNNWKKISNNLSLGDPLRQIAIAHSDTNYLYTTNGIKMWKTKDGGLVWNQLINSELAGLFITCLAIDNNNPEKLWITVSGYTETKKVFYSENGGVSWINYSESLPNVPVNCLVREDNSNDILYAGTDIGVYYRDASMSAWERFSTGLPNVEVSELEIQYNASKLRAGTRGRGLYETPITLTGSFENLYTQCFNGSAIPIGWGFEVLSNVNGNAPAIDFITTSENPPGFSAKKCSNFARFNSYTCETGDKLRLKMTNPVSAINADSLRLNFQMTVDNEYGSSNDTLITQYSINGTNWFNLDTLNRFDANGDKWIQVLNTLPDAAENQENIYLGFLFISAYGNDMHIDDINLEKVFPESPRFVSSTTNSSGTEIEITFNQEMTNPEGKHTEFVIDNGSILNPISIHLKIDDNKTFVLSLPTAVKFGQNLKISYTKGTITSVKGGILESFIYKTVTNKVNDPQGINEIEKPKMLNIFPNPNSGEFEIIFYQELMNEIEIKIYTSKGELVYEKKINRILKDQKYKINIGGKKPGVYKISINSGKNKFHQSFVIQ